jgi:hypothetical protein
MRLLSRKRWEYVGQARGKDGVWYTITGPCETPHEAQWQLNPPAIAAGVAKVVRRAASGATR